MFVTKPAAIAAIAPKDAPKFLRSGTQPVEKICTAANAASTNM